MSRHNQKSTLLNETGNIELYRITEETRRKVAEESKRIQDKMLAKNALSRKRFHQEENRKLRAHENQTRDMIKRWDTKTQNSPFRVNLTEKEERRLRTAEHREYKKQVDEYRNSTLDGMIGTKRFDVCNEHTMHLFDDHEVQLALALRRQTSDRAIVRRERSTLDQLMDIQFSEMKHRFPAVPQFKHIPTVVADDGGGSGLLRRSKSNLDGGLTRSNSKLLPKLKSANGRLMRSSGSNAMSSSSKCAMSENATSQPLSCDINISDNPADCEYGRLSRINSLDGSLADSCSLESGSGSVYRPPPPDAMTTLAQALESDFARTK